MGGLKTMATIHVPDYLILPFGRAVKSDLQKVALSAVSADGLYFSTDVPVIYINKSRKKPIFLSDFTEHFDVIPRDVWDNDELMPDYMCKTLKEHNPEMTRYEEMFLDLYFGLLTVLMLVRRDGNYQRMREAGLRAVQIYHSPDDVWRALLPIPEMQLYVQDPLANVRSFEPKNNFRVDYGFWDGHQLHAIEIDGAEPEGYAKDVRRDRLLRRAGVDVIHILNFELEKHRMHALRELLPAKFLGYEWDFEGMRPSPF
jgi:hypothetical protein